MELPSTVADAAAAIRAGECTSVELVEACIARADEHDAALGSYLARFDEYALATAAQVDAELAAGVDKGPMHGIPVGVKDILAMAEGPTTAQSLVLDPAWGAGKDAPVVRRLKAAGAVITGKTSTMEFAGGIPDPTKPFPVPANPWDLATWPGGSSSGTGSGVAAGFFLTGIGTDTGGSIRIPAAYCGVSGLMPTFGRVPKSGCTPLGYSLDHIGPLARSAWDCAAMMDVLAGYEPSDADSKDVPVPEYVASLDGVTTLDGVRIGVMRDLHFPDGIADPSAEPAFDAALAVLSELGAQLVDVRIPFYEEVLAALMVTCFSEATAYHFPDFRTRYLDYFKSTRTGMPGAVFTTGADYVQAQRVRRVGQHALAEVFAGVDLIATPTTCTGAPKLDDLQEWVAEGVTTKLFESVFTAYWDGVGNPVLVVPMGFTAAGLPLSLQLAGRPFDEVAPLRAGHVYQQSTDWHLQVPELAAATAA